jgi:phosphoribosylglycinamide formyltransferase-1
MKKTRVAVLLSGRGSNLQNLIKTAKPDFVSYEIAMVIADRDAPGLIFARESAIPTQIIAHRDRKLFAEAVEQAWIEAKIDLVSLAGFMRVLDRGLVERWNGKIINIHPSLLPDFPGLHPHRQVLAAGARISGCTVHFVTPEVDAGPIIAQAAVDVLPRDTEEQLAARILEAEHRLYPFVLDFLAREHCCK